MEEFILEMLRRFAVVNLYVILGLPGEEEADQDCLETLLERVLERRERCWSGHPGRVLVTSTPFQALPHTAYEREAAPSGALIDRWRGKMKRMRERYEYFFAFNIKTPMSADVAFSLYRFGPELAEVMEVLGPVRDKSIWGTDKARRFLRLCRERGLELRLGRLEGALPWDGYCRSDR